MSAFRRTCAAVALALSVAQSAAFAVAPALAAESAVIILYHRFGEDEYPSTNIRLAEFDAHIKELTSGGYTVLPLIDVLSAIRDGKPLPERAVAITIDDAFASIYSEAWPRLKKAKLPFTIFVATEPIDSKSSGMMSWDQLRELAANGVGIGAHSVTHLHMVEADDARNRRELAESNRRIAEELGKPAEIFAYPYGEASAHVIALAKEAGYRFALGQHSGVVDASGNDYFLPRFAINEAYGEISRLKLILNALPIAVADVTPRDPLVTQPNPPNFGFTVVGEYPRVGAISCYSSSEGRVKAERLGERRFEIRFARPLPVGRNRVNCTMPGPDERWRWYGAAFYVPKN